MASIDLHNYLISCIAKNIHTIGIFLDLSKAFYTVDHNIMLYKLRNYGFRGLVLTWFENYLTNRSQVVYFNDVTSNNLQIVCGVPQGSILGPLLFLLYINDLSNCSPVLKLVLFADDTNILISHNDITQLQIMLNTELQNVSTWFNLNKLSINVEKTVYMYFYNLKSNRNNAHDLVVKINKLDIN